jgi:ADP-heptose:LPS heptosyltransferase
VSLISGGYGFGKNNNSKKYINEAKNKNCKLKNAIFLDLSDLYFPLIKLLIGFDYTNYNNFKFNEKIVNFNNEKIITFHFRNIIKEGKDKRENFSNNNALSLIKLCKDNGYKTVCIGHPKYSYAPSNIDVDSRSLDLDQTLKILSNSKCCVGQLSGPIHLAQLLGIPIVTWAEGEWRFNIFPKWNPLNIKMEIVTKKTFNPCIKDIGLSINKLLNE